MKVKPDALSAERFRDMMESLPFVQYTARLQAALERLRADLEREDADAIKTAAIRGAIAHAKMTLALPAQMLQEISPKP